MRFWFFWIVCISCLGCQSPPAPSILLSNHPWWITWGDSLERQTLKASVPGYVLPDLVQSGKAPDPNFGTHERDVQWVENESWTYRVHVDLPSGWNPTDSASLEFQGLDTYASIWVNGTKWMETNNAFRTWVTPIFPLDSNGIDVVVAFEPTAKAGQRALDRHGLAVPAGNESKPIGTQTSPFTRKAGYQFGWDWGPRLAGPGISGHVILHRTKPPQILEFKRPKCTVVEANSNRAKVVVARRSGWELDIRLREKPVDWEWRQDTLWIENPELWWPTNMGKQPLYSFAWRHRATGASFQHNLGIRKLAWNTGSDAWGTTFQLEVNEVKVQARGANVIPPEYHDTGRCEAWIELVDRCLAADMNMVRVWGGGVYPPDCFFDECDRRGLLVWQDFMFACSMVPDDPDFVANVEKEAQEHVHRLRHRPSLALWCGNNEVMRAWHQWGWQDMYDLHGTDSIRLANAYDRIFHEVLPNVVSELGSVRYHPTSPTLEPTSGDEHAWEIWFGLEDFDYYGRNNGRFVSEYGLQSLPNMHTLQEAGIESFHEDALQYRQRSRMDWLEPGFDGWDMMLHFMAKTTGVPTDGDLSDWIFRSQVTQAEGLRQGLERHRTSGGRYSGSLYWSVNDIWPAVSWSTIDHAGRWKLGHYAARRANKATTAIWRRGRVDSLAIVVFNEAPTAMHSTLNVELCDFAGRIIRQATKTVNLDKRSELEVVLGNMTEWQFRPKDTYLRWRLEDKIAGEIVRATALWRPMVEAELKPASIEWTETTQGWRIESSTYVPVAYFTSDVPGHFSDNGIALEAGIPRTLEFLPEHALDNLGSLSIQTLQAQTSMQPHNLP